MTVNRIEFKASLGFVVLCALFLLSEIIHLPLVLAAICGVLALVALVVGVFARQDETIGDKIYASATVEDEAELAPETTVHVQFVTEFHQRPSQMAEIHFLPLDKKKLH